MNCPRCKVPLNEIKVGRGHAQLCSQCEGVWFDSRGLEVFLEMAEDDIKSSPLGVTMVADHGDVPVEKTVHCPVCDGHMKRYNYCGDSGVLVDACVHHGVWLDDGELARILHYVHASDEMFNDLSTAEILPRASSGFLSSLTGWFRGLR